MSLRLAAAALVFAIAIVVGVVFARARSDPADEGLVAERTPMAAPTPALCAPLLDAELRARTTDVVGYIARVGSGIAVHVLDAQPCASMRRGSDWPIATRPLTHGSELAGPMIWSKDGSRILYATAWFDVESSTGRQVIDIWSVNIDGSDHRRVVSDVTMPDDGSSLWSAIDLDDDDSFDLRDSAGSPTTAPRSLSSDGARIAYKVPGFEMNMICIAPVTQGKPDPYRCVGGGGITSPQLGSPKWSPH